MSLIWIAGNVPSSKNSKVATSGGVFLSKTVRKYLQDLGVKKYSVRRKDYKNYKTRPNKFEALSEVFKKEIANKSYPLKVGFHFVRDSKRKFDFHNMVQIIADLMVAHNFIEEDDMDHFLPVPFKMNGRWYTYNKENPGVYVKFY
jgi:hypothetical protein